jgi:hypothetical protein
MAALTFALSACESVDDEDHISDDLLVNAQQEPPRPESEVIPRLADPQGEIWRPGYWIPSGTGFAWVPGKVIHRPIPTAVWHPATWMHHTYGWSFQQGHWE